MQKITFGEIRKYCSVINRVSICMKETLCYENFDCIREIPHSYDEKYLYGFGVTDSEFENSIMKCLEIVLSEEPRN